MLDSNRRLIEKYYHELWNEWNFALAGELISPAVKFHGSVGVAVEGLDGFLDYMRLIRAAFPDFHNTLEEMVAEHNRVAARLTYRGTHRGPIFGVAPTGRTSTTMAWRCFTSTAAGSFPGTSSEMSFTCSANSAFL
jgi:predicted ester cyclase